MPRCCGRRLSLRRPPFASVRPKARLPRQILVIFNPAAGRGRRHAKRLTRVVAELERRGCSVTVLPTRAPGDAERLAREADLAFDLIVAAGGDGTVNEVANGIYAASRPLAVLPLGTGNVLANEIGLPRDPRRLARIIADGTPKPIWPGRAGDRLFLAMTGVGFDAEVLGALDPCLRHRIGKLGYIWAILLCLWRYRQAEFVVGIEAGAYRAASVIVTTGRLYAGRFVIAPQARTSRCYISCCFKERGGWPFCAISARCCSVGCTGGRTSRSSLRAARQSPRANRRLDLRWWRPTVKFVAGCRCRSRSPQDRCSSSNPVAASPAISGTSPQRRLFD
jgi:diacylglycerol kinase (ATP)